MTPLDMPVLWRVLIHFGDTKVTLLAHIPTDEQQRGCHMGRLHIPDPWSFELSQLFVLVEAVGSNEAKAKARQLLIDYVQNGVTP